MRFGTLRRGARALLAGALFLVATGGGALAQPPDAVEAGRELFVRYCSACHGVDARGGGPVAELLKIPTPDLTKIATRREGRFPESEIEQIVDGRKPVRGHGTREMPVWGRRFASDEPFGAPSEPSVQSQLALLVLHLRSIQESMGAQAPLPAAPGPETPAAPPVASIR